MNALIAIALLAQSLHLEDAFARARAASPEMAAARESVRAAQATVETAGQLLNPTVGVSVGPDEPTIFGTIDLRLPILGQRGTAIAAAERDVQAVQADAEARSVVLRAQVRRAYAILAAAQVRAQVAQRALDLATDLEQRTAAKVQTGLAPQLEALQAQVARRRVQQERNDRASALVTARGELARLIALPDASSLQAAAPPWPLAPPPPLDDLLARSAQHPEVRALLGQQDAALARAQRERAAVRPLPDVSLQIQKMQGQPCGPSGNMSCPWVGLRWGLVFDLPVLSWNGGRVHEAQAQAAVASSLAQAALLKRRSDLRAARSRWDAAAARASSYTGEIVPAAQTLVQMARQAWDLGRAPLITVLQAQGELNGAQAEASDAALAAQNAFADLEEAAGAGL